MNARAFIIAIEDYPNSTTLAQQLPGTNIDAEAFRAWLIDKKKVDTASILACAGPGCAWRTTGTTHDEIVAELQKLSTSWKEEDNDELYFYFSGHGFSYEADNATIQIDVFVASDFVDADNSGDACLQFQEVQKKLWLSMGPGNHYYFIDACRNPIARDDIEVPIIGKKFPSSSRGRSKYYALYSTALGQVAKVNSGFTQLLLKGLNGGGTAKKWEAGKMYVTFERLRDYLKAKLKNQEIEANTGADGDGFIMELRPVPEYDCEVLVANAASEDSFTLKVSNDLMGDKSHPFQGGSHKVQLKPFDYFLEVTHPSATVVQVDPPLPGPLSLYDPAVVRFRKNPTTRSARGPAAVVAAREANVTLEAAPGTEIHLLHEESGKTISDFGSLTANVAPGKYVAQVVERGTPIQRSSVTIEPGKDIVIDLLDRPKSEVRERILNSFSHSGTSRYAAFSETLGNMANWDLSLWLSVFGASHIASDPDRFSMLKNLPTDRFRDVKKNDSPVYVLAGFEKSRGPFDVSLSDGSKVKWEPLNKVDGLVGIYEKRIKARAGSHLLSLRIERQSPVTLAVFCLPNRATFVTFAEDTGGGLRVHQYLLPIYSLFQYLDPRVLDYLSIAPLGMARTMALAQSRFANNQQVMPQKDAEEKRDWDALMLGKWLDPIMSLIACYEIIRRGKIESQKENLKTVIGNLHRYFPDIPDTQVIARLIGLKANRIADPPLLMDGVLALEDSEDILTLPASKLDYGSPWTTWRGAVSDAVAPAGRTPARNVVATPGVTTGKSARPVTSAYAKPASGTVTAARTRSMSKVELATELAGAIDTSRKTAAAFLNALSSIARREIKRSGEFVIPGIGTLVKEQTKARTGRNPATGALIKIPAKTLLTFRVAEAAKAALAKKAGKITKA
jgi:DNA-binding protein HU-beta